MTIDDETLIDSFAAKQISASEFEKLYLKAFRSEPKGAGARVFKVLERLFSDVDSYSPDCEEGKESAFEISEVELRRQAAKALADLRRLCHEPSIPKR